MENQVYAIREHWSKAQGYILITRKFHQKLKDISLKNIKRRGTTA
ncbi:MAG: hypothetical protein ACPLW8_03375 [Candidatus Bathyarchaeales archaeon]